VEGNYKTDQFNSIKTISVIKLILLNILTLGLYSIYWYLNRTSILLGMTGRKMPPYLYLVAIGGEIASKFLFIIPAIEGWLKFGQYGMTVVWFIWALWLSRLIRKIWALPLVSNKILTTINLFLFGHLYLQYKLNLLAEAKKGGKEAISSDKWLNRITSAGCALFVLGIFARLFLINWYNVPTKTMTPTIVPGDHVLSNRVAYWSVDDVLRGDLIVFKYPKEPSTSYIKRVVGKPGDKVRIEDNQVFVNDVLQKKVKIDRHEDLVADLPYVKSDDILFDETIDANTHTILEHSPTQVLLNRSFPTSAGYSYTVPENSLFVLGDYRDESFDSRDWGQVPFENVEGKILMILWNSNIHKDEFGHFHNLRFFLKIK
jgi:signal peptidase I